jgi:chromosome segregation ATPase
VVEPDLPELPHHFELTAEQEIEMRQKIELSLKESFERDLKRAVSEVAKRRESMQSEMAIYSERSLVDGDRRFAQEIAGIRAQIQELQDEIQSGVETIHCLKTDWTESNHTRKDKEDLIMKLQNGNSRLKTRVDELVAQLTKLNQECANEEDDREAEEIHDELEKLAKDVGREKRYHFHLMKKKGTAHDESMAQIKERVRQLAEGKDELIARLRAEIQATKTKAKTVEQDIRNKFSTYAKA